MTSLRPLRPYQIAAIQSGRQAFREGKRAILFVSPTGSGKTRLGAEFIVNATRTGRRVLWLAHRAELLAQTRETVIGEGISDVGVISAALPHLRNPRASVQIASLQTLHARDLAPEAELVIFDEAHHYVASEWLEFANRYSHATRLGLTATPVRSDGTPLGDLFDSLITVASIRDLTEQGYLVPCEVIGPDRHQGSQKLAQEPVAAWQQYARNLRTVVFARSVQHAKDLAEQFRAAGARATHVDGTTPRVIREHTLDDFRRGKLDVLVNMFVLTEGFDAPGAECCLLARSCGSLGTYLQMVGRVLRPAPGKTKALLLDLPGVVHNHGMPDADREYSLDGEGIRSVKKPSLRQCKHCGAVHPPAPVCPRCGHVYPIEDKTPSVTGVDLRKLSTADLNDDSKREAFIDMLKIAAARGYKPGWAFYRFVVKFNMKPPRSWGLHEEAAA